MPELAFAVSAYQRDRGNIPGLPVVNMFLEKAAPEPFGIALQSRPGLVDNGVTSGTDDVVGVFKKDGVLNGDLFTVTRGAQTRLFRNGSLVGIISGTGPVSFAGNEIGLAVCAGANVHFYDGSALGTADFPDNANVCKVLEIAGRFIALRSGTQKFYWTAVLESALVAGILTFLPLAFASAENEPDQLLDACAYDDKLILAGTETVEFWQKTGDNDLPFDPIEGLVYKKGVKATGCLVPYDNSFAYVSREGLVYRGGNEPQRFSDSGIEERLAASSGAALFTFFWEGHEFLALRLDSETWVADAMFPGNWYEWATSGETNWIATCACPGPIFGGPDGMTLAFGDVHTDLGGELERRFRAGIVLTGQSLSFDNIRLRTNPGTTPYLTGQFADPVCEMRYSRDGGNEWSDWKSAKLGSQGQYRKRLEWRCLGSFEDPGALFEFRVVDPVPFRVSGTYYNEDGGGRSR
jgi:hypothetical protein